MWCEFLRHEKKNSFSNYDQSNDLDYDPDREKSLEDDECFACCSQTGYPCVCLDASDEEVRKCFEKRSLCGFLSPDGTYCPCPPYGHTSEAERICKKILNVDINGVEAEYYLQISSWVCLYARTVGFLSTGYLPIYKGSDERKFIRLLTDKQIEFLEEAMKFCCIEDKYNDIKGILEEDYHLKNDPTYRKLIEETLL